MERIQKILARGGIASRRAAEQLITEGRVRVNGRVVSELGAKADPRKDKIEVDGKRVVAEHHVYIVLHKPRGVVATTSDPEGRPTVGEILKNVGARVFPVGRLDFATSGVLLATNDGEMADGLRQLVAVRGDGGADLVGRALVAHAFFLASATACWVALASAMARASTGPPPFLRSFTAMKAASPARSTKKTVARR